MNIKKAIDRDDVVLFMKGNRKFPQCGFSDRVVEILKQYKVKYTEYNVLTEPNLREDIKKYSDWPTIPQLYIKGEFIGGCDIVYDMYQAGELKSLFKGLS